jgi:hypothetical protein
MAVLIAGRGYKLPARRRHFLASRSESTIHQFHRQDADAAYEQLMERGSAW